MTGSRISGAGGLSQPNRYAYYDISVSSLTVAAGSTGTLFPIPNTIKAYRINPIYATNAGTLGGSGSRRLINVLDFNLSFIVSTDTTDVTYISVDYSIDNKATWTSMLTSQNVSAHSPNNAFLQNYQGVFSPEINGLVTGNQIWLRTSINDSTDPTTDALTLTNFRLTMGLVLAV